jgi:hypothetical protein
MNQVYRLATTPNLAYICCDDTQINYVQSRVNGYGYTNCSVNTYCSFTPGGVFYTIKGKNTFDANNNGCDANDPIYPNLKYRIIGSTTTGNIISNASGNYAIPVQAGTYTIKPLLENPTYFTATPDSVQITFPNAINDTIVQNFCIAPNGVHHDVEISVIPTSNARPGFDATYQIVYKNKGNQIENGSVALQFDDAHIDFVTANPAPDNQVVNNLTWNYVNLLPLETRTITATFNLNNPQETPPLNAGDILNYTASVTPLATDEIPNDNTATLAQTIVGSLDPNDKTCLEGDQILPNKVGDYLHYVINFENTGTANATNIVVKDVIDLAKYNIASLQITKASHDCRVRILNNNGS